MITCQDCNRSINQLLCLILGSQKSRASNHLGYNPAERIEEARDEWQCTSNEDDDAMRKIYGIHPELFVDYQMDVVVMLRQMTFQEAQRAVQLNDAARSAKAEFDKVIDEIGKQYDALKSKWEALQSNDKEESK